VIEGMAIDRALARKAKRRILVDPGRNTAIGRRLFRGEKTKEKDDTSRAEAEKLWDTYTSKIRPVAKEMGFERVDEMRRVWIRSHRRSGQFVKGHYRIIEAKGVESEKTEQLENLALEYLKEKGDKPSAWANRCDELAFDLKKWGSGRGIKLRVMAIEGDLDPWPWYRHLVAVDSSGKVHDIFSPKPVSLKQLAKDLFPGKEVSWREVVKGGKLHDVDLQTKQLYEKNKARVDALRENTISFPKREHAALKQRLSEDKTIFTSRVSVEQDRYKPGDILDSSLGSLKVKNVRSFESVEQHPFKNELADKDKETLRRHGKYDLVELEKAEKEYAPGIPEKHKQREVPTNHSATTWFLSTQRHFAQRRGEHVDLRLGDPESGTAFSFAMPAAGLPAPGNAVRVPRVDDHTVDYMNFSGTITVDYGKGIVKSEIYEPTEVVSSSPNEIRFNRYKGRLIEEYVARHLKGNIWEVRNYTPTRERYPEIPRERPKYKNVSYKDIDVENNDEIIQAKIDGAHILVHFRKAGRPPNVYSYRPGKTGAHDLINHSHKFEALRESIVPKELEGLVVRGEGFVRDSEGRVAPVQTTSAALNAGVWKSRNLQLKEGPLSVAIFDVVSHKGKSLSSLPYRHKWEILQRVHNRFNLVELPDTATDKRPKQQLLDRIRRDKHPDTKEGVVIWSKGVPGPRRAKIRPDFDVYVRRIEKGKGRLEHGMAGAFSYSLTPTSSIVGTVGTGLSDNMRRDMISNPKKYVGKVVTVHGLGQYPSGAVRAPSFYRFHPEKNQ